MCHISMKIAQNPLQVGGTFPNPSLHIFAAPRSLAFRQAILAAKGASGDSEAAKKARDPIGPKWVPAMARFLPETSSKKSW